MSHFEVIEGRARHAGQLSRTLRSAHQQAMRSLGVDCHRQLRRSYDESYYRRAWLIDGELSALGGVIGSTVGPHGFVWLAMSERATRYPTEVVRMVRDQLEYLMLSKSELVTSITLGDEAALRFAAFLGFHVEDRGEGGPAFSHHGRRRLLRYLRTNPELRQPVGSGIGVCLGYHGAPQ